MKIKRFFKLRKGDYIIASNAEEGLYVIKSSSGNAKVYRDGDLFFNTVDTAKGYYYTYNVQFVTPEGSLVYNLDNGLISYLALPEYYGKGKVIFRKGFKLQVLDTKTRESYTIIQDIRNYSINYTTLENKPDELLLTINSEDTTKFYILGKQSPIFTINHNTYMGYGFIAKETRTGITIRRFNKRDYRDIAIVKHFDYEEIFNFVPSKGELK